MAVAARSADEDLKQVLGSDIAEIWTRAAAKTASTRTSETDTAGGVVLFTDLCTELVWHFSQFKILSECKTLGMDVSRVGWLLRQLNTAHRRPFKGRRLRELAGILLLEPADQTTRAQDFAQLVAMAVVRCTPKPQTIRCSMCRQTQPIKPNKCLLWVLCQPEPLQEHLEEPDTEETDDESPETSETPAIEAAPPG